MPGAKQKKLSLLASREDMENILRDLILLGCVDVSEPDALLEGQELTSGAKLEILALDQLNANRDSIVLIGTHYTLSLSGWMAAGAEAELLSVLGNYVCAWSIENPTPDEFSNMPVDLCCPDFLGKLRRRGRRKFDPLMAAGHVVGEAERAEHSNE